VDPVAVNLFLRFRYTPSPLTIFKGIRKLAPRDDVGCGRRRVRSEEMVQLCTGSVESTKEDETGPGVNYSTCIGQPSKRHLLSDVPVGILLSGGLDSGLLPCFDGRKQEDYGHPTRWATGDSFADDELNGRGRETALLMGFPAISPVLLDQTEFGKVPSPYRRMSGGASRRTLVHRADVLCLPSAARQDVKVALIGQGPDEIVRWLQTAYWACHYGNYWRGRAEGKYGRWSVRQWGRFTSQRDL